MWDECNCAVVLHNLDNHDGVITHLEPDILEYEVKWALGSITTNKASGGDGIPVELFKILKDDAVKVLHSICQQIWKTEQGPQDWKSSVFIPIPKKGKAKECSNYCTAAAAAKSLQSCLTLCDPIDGSPPGSPVPGILQARTLEVGCHFLLQCMKVKSESDVAQSCPTLHDPMDCSLPGSSTHGIFQARVLEWGAIAFSKSIHRIR